MGFSEVVNEDHRGLENQGIKPLIFYLAIKLVSGNKTE